MQTEQSRIKPAAISISFERVSRTGRIDMCFTIVMIISSTARIPTHLPQNYQPPKFATIPLISQTFSSRMHQLLLNNKISSPTALFSFIYILTRLFNSGGAYKLPYPFIAPVPIQKRQPRYHNEAAQGVNKIFIWKTL